MRKLSARRQAFFVNLFLAAVIFSIGAVCFFPTVSETSADRRRAYYEGNSASGVSLMINVYWGTETLNAMLDVLGEFGATATFFIGGCWADDNAVTLKRIADEGHEIGSHGYFHKDHTLLSLRENAEEIGASVRFLQAATERDIRLFAPPSGAYNENTLTAAEDLGLKVIMWSKDTIDWRDKDEDVCYRRATENVEGGDFILMHPMEHTLKALPRILSELGRKGLKMMSVSENLGEGTV